MVRTNSIWPVPCIVSGTVAVPNKKCKSGACRMQFMQTSDDAGACRPAERAQERRAARGGRLTPPAPRRPVADYRSVAANSRSSALRILARTPAMSFSLSVRSGERMTTRRASERLSGGIWSPS